MTALSFGSDYTQAHAYEGQETWYRVKFRMPSRMPSCGDWNWLTVWHVDQTTQSNGAGHIVSDALGIYTDSTTSCANPHLVMRFAGGSTTNPVYQEFGAGALTFGRWYDLLWHYRWSKSNSTGLEEFWLDGNLVVSKPVATLFTRTDGTSGAYSFGLYNYHYVSPTLGDWQSQTEWDNVSIGPTRASVGG
jgi:hypothetical protein